MGNKNEEYAIKKRNKTTRKRLRNTVDFVHGVQAAKRRRKAGRRRVCEGMCYSLPTPEDPFNDQYQKRLGKEKASKAKKYDKDVPAELKHEIAVTGTNINSEYKIKSHRGEGKKEMLQEKPIKRLGHIKNSSAMARHFQCAGSNETKDGSENWTFYKQESGVQSGSATTNGITRTGKVMWRPSVERCVKKNDIWTAVAGDAFERSLCAILNAGLLTESKVKKSDEKEFHIRKKKMMKESKWDWQFWQACGSGWDVLATRNADGGLCQADYVLAAAAHIAAKRLQHTFCPNPVVLFVVHSQEQTRQVRSICKLLKQALRIHSVSLHTGTTLQHQIEGLSSNSPEILVATPDRLCKLLATDAVSVSSVSFMVVDGIEELISCGFVELLMKIRSSVDATAQTVVISENISYRGADICRQLLKDPISRVLSDNSLVQRSACITQNVSVIVSEEKRLKKLAQILKQYFVKRQDGSILQGIVVLFRQHDILTTVKVAVEAEGYKVGCFNGSRINGGEPTATVLKQFRKRQVEVLLAMEEFVGQMDIGGVETVINYEFPSTMHMYNEILRGMASHTVHGMLHSFCTGAAAPMASQLVELLLQCLQPVPSPLRMLAEAALIIGQPKLNP